MLNVYGYVCAVLAVLIFLCTCVEVVKLSKERFARAAQTLGTAVFRCVALTRGKIHQSRITSFRAT